MSHLLQSTLLPSKHYLTPRTHTGLQSQRSLHANEKQSAQREDYQVSHLFSKAPKHYSFDLFLWFFTLLSCTSSAAFLFFWHWRYFYIKPCHFTFFIQPFRHFSSNGCWPVLRGLYCPSPRLMSWSLWSGLNNGLLAIKQGCGKRDWLRVRVNSFSISISVFVVAKFDF